MFMVSFLFRFFLRDLVYGTWEVSESQEAKSAASNYKKNLIHEWN